MDIRPTRGASDHAEAPEAVSALIDQNPEWGTPAFDCMDVLTTLIEAYEAHKAPIGFPDPIKAIETRLADKGISERTLASVACIPESKISEVLGYKRALSINRIVRHGNQLWRQSPRADRAPRDDKTREV